MRVEIWTVNLFESGLLGNKRVQVNNYRPDKVNI